MKTIIHDLSAENFAALGIGNGANIINADNQYAPCKGCFKCWLKNSGYCVMTDKLQHIGGLIGNSEEIVIISKLCYGGYSAPIKKLLDRSISDSLPFFTIKNGKVRHTKRYDTPKHLCTYFYGECSEFEKETATALAEANRANMGRESVSVNFVAEVQILKEVLA